MAPQLLAWSHAMVAMYQARRDRGVEDARQRRRPRLRRLPPRPCRGAAPPTRRRPDHRADRRRGRRRPARHRRADRHLRPAAQRRPRGDGPRHRQRRRRDPRRRARPGAASSPTPAATAATVEEVLRFDPPLHLFTRFALADVEVFGHRFRPGDTVGCLLAAANRDPARFPDPGRFDPARPAGPHLAFGAGIHFCVGAPLARAELAIALPILFAPPPGTRAGRAAGLRRPLPLPRPRRASARSDAEIPLAPATIS